MIGKKLVKKRKEKDKEWKREERFIIGGDEKEKS